MADANYTQHQTIPLKPDARSSNGTPLFNNQCPKCGAVRLSDKRRLGKPCHPCSRDGTKTHGMSNHPLFKMRINMINRCTRPTSTHYRYYGGRGIDVCVEWKTIPEAFFDWAKANGYCEGMEIDRIDVNGPYSPENCRFLSHEVNSQLRRSARCTIEQARHVKELLASGESVKMAAGNAGVPYMTAWHISKGNTWRNA